MATTYYETATNSALNKNTVTAPANSAKLLQTAPGAGTSVAITTALANALHWFITDAGDPDTTGGTGSRSYSLALNVTVANMNYTSNVKVHRLNSAGTSQANVAVTTADGVAWPQTTGVKTFTGTGDLGTFAAGDRFAVEISIGSGTGMAQTANIEVGLANGNEEVTAPWTFTGPERAGALKVPRTVVQAVNRSACWMRRRSGVVVPRLWTPVGA